MPPYFKPLRRKFGVLLLLLACVLTAGWMRSFLVDCDLDVIRNRFRLACLLGNGTVHIGLRETDYTEKWDWYSYPMDEERTRDWSDIARGRMQMRGFKSWWAIPCWSIVLPLTLLSAWLLLSKPRVKKMESTDLLSKTNP